MGSRRGTVQWPSAGVRSGFTTLVFLVLIAVGGGPSLAERFADGQPQPVRIEAEPDLTAAPPSWASSDYGVSALGRLSPAPSASAPADAAPTGPAATTSPPTTAGPTVNPPAPQTVEGRGQAALQRISYPWREYLPEWTITFHEPRQGVYGYTLVKEQRIEIYVRPNQTDELLTHVIAHEIGHAIDVTHNTPTERTAWQEARGIGSAPWWPTSGASDFATGAGDFAESFAAWRVGSESFRSKLAGPPTVQQIQLLDQLSRP